MIRLVPLQVACRCGKTLKAPDHLAGKRVRCPGCGNVLSLPPAASAPPAARAASSPQPPRYASARAAPGRSARPAPPATRPCPDCGKPLSAVPCPQCGWEPAATEPGEQSGEQDFGFLDQFKALLGMLISPRQTLLALPTGRICWVGFLVSFYFTYARAERTGAMRQAGSGFFALGVVAVLAVLAYLLGGFVLKLVVRLFGKCLAYRKVLNLLGYAQAPRLFVALPASLVVTCMPKAAKTAFLAGEYKAATLVLVVLGSGLLLYSVFLQIWGLVISPDQRAR